LGGARATGDRATTAVATVVKAAAAMLRCELGIIKRHKEMHGIDAWRNL
jgi:hypothetical protein